MSTKSVIVYTFATTICVDIRRPARYPVPAGEGCAVDYLSLADELERALGDVLGHPARQRSLGLRRGELGVLGYLAFARDGATPGELREHLNVGSGRVADPLNALERKGLIRRAVDPADSRRVIVSITETGRARIQEERMAFRREQARLLEALGPEDAAEFVRLMGRVASLSRRT